MPTRIETYPYPFDAQREAVYNSLMHNDWSYGQSILIKVYDHSSAYSTELLLMRTGLLKIISRGI